MLKSDFLMLNVGEKVRFVKDEPGWDCYFNRVFTIREVGAFWVSVVETQGYFYYNEIERA